MFDYQYTIRKLINFDSMPNKKQKKFLRNLFTDDGFMEYLFNPKKTENTENEIIALYQNITKPSVIRAINDMVEDAGYDQFDRSAATFMTSIVNQGIAYNNERIDEGASARRTNDISGKDFKDIKDKTEKYNEYLAKLLKASRKIVKAQAKELAKKTGIPRYVCIIALKGVPETKFVKNYKVAYYLSNILNNIYAEVDRIGDFSSGVDWKTFFQVVFGKGNTSEAASFILLEGVGRIKKYENSDDVRACWDSLTTFALKELNDVPDQLRNQMIELYIKRIAKMFANGSKDLRVDLTGIDASIFPKLAKSVSAYADKINAILNSK